MDPPEAACRIVDSLAATLQLVEDIQHVAPSASRGRFLYIALDGVRLSRHGSVSLVSIYVQPLHRVYLVDVHTLRGVAFAARTPLGLSLQAILESRRMLKCFFDVRHAADALFSLYGVRLDNVEDIQLMENAARRAGTRTRLAGLARCIANDAPLSYAGKHHWERARHQALRLFHPDKGGAHAALDQRPLDPDLLQYCVNNVQYLPQLLDTYRDRLEPTWLARVDDETEERIQQSQSELYEPFSEDRKLGPWPDEDVQEVVLREEREARYKAAVDEYFEDVMAD